MNHLLCPCVLCLISQAFEARSLLGLVVGAFCGRSGSHIAWVFSLVGRGGSVIVIENYQHGPRMAFAVHSFKNQLCALSCHKVVIGIPCVVRGSQFPQELSAGLCTLP